MALTYKQDKFCQNIVKGMTVADAYISAYDSKGKPTTIATEGTRLLAREDIQERIKALSKPLQIKAQTDALSERERKKAIIWEGIEQCRQSGDHNGVARYMDILNKMDMEYINVNRNIDSTDKAIDGLTVDQLKQLASESL